jgi:hypothetical protein
MMDARERRTARNIRIRDQRGTLWHVPMAALCGPTEDPALVADLRRARAAQGSRAALLRTVEAAQT